MIYQYAFNISEIKSFQQVENLFMLLSEERKERIRRFRFEKDKLHCLFAELILKYALRECFRICDFTLDKNVYGKPRLSGYEGIWFNLSHSGDWVVCGVGDQNLGIDVERIEKIEKDIAKDFFADEEIKLLTMTSEKDWMNVFYTIWTLKESYTKNIGEGMSIPLDSFAILPQKACIDLYIRGEKSDKFTFQTCDLDAMHKMALCVSGTRIDLNNPIAILHLNDFTK